jgi:hypothetical protein
MKMLFLETGKYKKAFLSWSVNTFSEQPSGNIYFLLNFLKNKTFLINNALNSP